VSEFAVDYKKTNWKLANCLGMDVNLFYIPDDEPRANKSTRVEFTRSVCGPCVIQEQCLEFGLKHEQFGMRGGLTAEERRFLKTGENGGRGVMLGIKQFNDLGLNIGLVHKIIKRIKDEA
jgi:hypothetical protein